MYPDDQQNPNQNSMGQAPQPFNYGQQPQNQPPQRNMKWLLWAGIGLVVLIVAIVLAVALSGGDKTKENDGATSNDKTSQQSGQSTSDDECAASLRRYTNKDLSLGFCYPKSWGDVSLKDAKFDPSDSGTRVRLSFEDKPEIHVGLVSDDWSTDAPRDGVCEDPAVQAFPATDDFSAKWVSETDGAQIVYAVRGHEVTKDEFLIRETIDKVTANGVCLEGYKLTNGEVYRHAAASYSAEFGEKISTPEAHIDKPTTLISAKDRTDFAAFVKSMHSE